jgi:tRNA-binding protein
VSSPDAATSIGFDDFLKVDIRVGTVLEAAPLEGARKPAYRMRIDFGGDIGVKASSAQITAKYRAQDLVGRQVMAVVNFPPRQIGRFMSQVLTLGFADGDGAILLAVPESTVPNGARLV